MRIVLSCLTFFLVFNNNYKLYSQKTYVLPEAVKIELSRLDAAFKILDLYSDNIWQGWNDYLSYPIHMTFPNGLEIIINNPKQTKEFVLCSDIKIHGLNIYIDTTKLNYSEVKLPLMFGGGVGTTAGKSPQDVNYNFSDPTLKQLKTPELLSAEYHILLFIHELVHYFQYKVAVAQVGNLFLNPDLNQAIYSDIEGRALALAYSQNSKENSISYLKDFCIARNLGTRVLTQTQHIQYDRDEFYEGHATFAEYAILQCFNKAPEKSVSLNNDPEYNKFVYSDYYLNRIIGKLKQYSGDTFNSYEKHYYYGCFLIILLQRYFPDWQEEIEKGFWLSQILNNKLRISSEDSLVAIQRFHTIYNVDSLKSIHNKIITKKDSLIKIFKSAKGRSLIISTSPVHYAWMQFIDDSTTNYYNEVGPVVLYPNGIGNVNFGHVNISAISYPVEISDLFQLRVIDTLISAKAFSINYQSKDSNGYYINAKIETSIFTLTAPKVSVFETKDIILFIILEK